MPSMCSLMVQTGRQVNSFAQTKYLIKLSGQTGFDRPSAHHRPPQDGGAKRTMTCWRKRRRKLRNWLVMNENNEVVLLILRDFFVSLHTK